MLFKLAVLLNYNNLRKTTVYTVCNDIFNVISNCRTITPINDEPILQIKKDISERKDSYVGKMCKIIIATL